MKHTSICTILFVLCSSWMTTMAAPLDKRGIKSCYNNVLITEYWIPKEGDKDMLNDGQLVTLSGPKTKALKTVNGKTIAKVSQKTYEKFQMEGTGLLKDGVMVNLDSGKNSFITLDRKKTPYGLGTDSGKLTPWVSVAVNDVKKGTKLYIKKLDGLKLPNGKVHNGCVRVDDEGWSMSGCHIDFFVLQYSAYKDLSKKLPNKLKAVQKNCVIKDYVNPATKKWAVL
ncbi:hypothetical protein EDC96DRAFT_519449 [Choanephora cucurbitarum]|nr:hypothetical protein EDC96DRAFT_519449 [Choanephora cucurbitarum]